MSIEVSYRTTLAGDGCVSGTCLRSSFATFEAITIAATVRAAQRSGWAITDEATCPFC
ncbi:hypothetical protein [Paenarthrobacter sp. YJN-5]|uniref:hypothetical protein n=1 Tax=unclassified Paenarthrobacter TaxID=2634190 RepID=UPI00187870BB|nr:hypothetical protein [Paenarthrobacter sp. YJN-5]QOT19516.1 hypothetical protein HMI59_23070 [Paenarthrobacter sp. YJN-5]